MRQPQFKHLSNRELVQRINRAADFGKDDEEVELEIRIKEAGGLFECFMDINTLRIRKNWEMLCFTTKANPVGVFEMVDCWGNFYVRSGHYFSDKSWTFLGTSKKQHGRIENSFDNIWATPDVAVKGWVHDLDHGTHRVWAGNPVPRIVVCWRPDLDNVKRILDIKAHHRREAMSRRTSF